LPLRQEGVDPRFGGELRGAVRLPRELIEVVADAPEVPNQLLLGRVAARLRHRPERRFAHVAGDRAPALARAFA
jgi:hypothetical protein